MKKTVFVGVPLDLGTENLGVDIGPSALRHEGIIEKLKKSGIDIQDGGDIPCKLKEKLSIGNPKIKYLEEVVCVSENSANVTAKAIKQGFRILAAGGDHSISLGLVSGASTALKGQLGLIYIDAHADMNTDKTTMTGNIHGMPVSALLGFGNRNLKNIYREKIKIQKQDLLLIGGKDFDKAEEELIAKEQIEAFTVNDLLSSGLNPLFEKIDLLYSRVKNIWVSLDLDAIDYIYAPGVGMANNGGLTYREIAAIAKYIGSKCNIVGLDIAEYNPLRDVGGKTAELAIELCAKLLGSDYSWYTNYLEKNRI